MDYADRKGYFRAYYTANKAKYRARDKAAAPARAAAARRSQIDKILTQDEVDVVTRAAMREAARKWRERY